MSGHGVGVFTRLAAHAGRARTLHREPEDQHQGQRYMHRSAELYRQHNPIIRDMTA
jgi:hypothetical protein